MKTVMIVGYDSNLFLPPAEGKVIEGVFLVHMKSESDLEEILGKEKERYGEEEPNLEFLLQKLKERKIIEGFEKKEALSFDTYVRED